MGLLGVVGGRRHSEHPRGNGLVEKCLATKKGQTNQLQKNRSAGPELPVESWN